ncbi:hypothetical protein KI372_07865 [Halobacterium salinarum]|uniref:DUF7321 family protein n=1 Tax=Halobacterium salinarum TaxID=2242 RepID=UPI001F408A8A|nr:hypothetical protein [Halobacterium salinarum]MCF2207861.1 hypothetical protein [Halobacterium salinarum]MCF2241283.1 hypothetical protein [Halobacterium salinarum]
MVEDVAVATLAAALVTLSFPFYIYGAWIIIDADPVTWGVLRHHLSYIIVGLTLNTVPVVTWMAPRLLGQLGGFAALHAFFGVQAYAFLVFALTGIVPILRAKRQYNLYNDPEPSLEIDDIHENMGAWRLRLRAGVAGYVLCWLVAWVLGLARYVIRYPEFPF